MLIMHVISFRGSVKFVITMVMEIVKMLYKHTDPQIQ